MAATVKGESSPIQQPTQVEKRADGSRETTYEWEGIPDGIETLESTVASSGDYDRVRHERGKVTSRLIAVVEVADGDGVPLEPGVRREWWELDRNLVDIPLAMHPYFSGAGYIDILETNYLEPGVTPSFGSDDLAGAGEQDEQYYYHRIKGVDSVPYSTYVLRHCKLVREGTLAKSDHSDVHTVVALPAGVPTALIGVIPDEYEWLKQPPDVRQTERYSYELSQEYWSGMPLWSVIYGGTWDPTP